MKEQVAGRTGASWEDRLQEQKMKKVQAMKCIEKEQKEKIKFATERGIEKQQVYSPLLTLRSSPSLSIAEKQAQRLEDWVHFDCLGLFVLWLGKIKYVVKY